MSVWESKTGRFDESLMAVIQAADLETLTSLMLSARPIDALLTLTEILLNQPESARLVELQKNERLGEFWRAYVAVTEDDNRYAQQLERKIFEISNS